MKSIILIIYIVFSTFSAFSFPIPTDGEVSFDIIRKNKTIGNIVTKFTKEDQMIKIHRRLMKYQ